MEVDKWNGRWRRAVMLEVNFMRHLAPSPSLYAYSADRKTLGNIPRFMTNSSLASSISEDVPSFLKWMVRRFPEGGEVESEAVVAVS